eukprot:TRINITY_DN8110_c0_g1_i1.p1 TRINITY_DN8110_c0_g1~~TRINITY_DN8110_c0_g1_i1.p1  ORF type:complete len:182 (+),score=35.09 TRINITY_DN8110_c0_g1_i1:106-651(+)
MLSPERSPVFSYQHDNELKDLMAEYLLPSQQDPTAFQEEQAKNQQILWAQFQFQRIMRDYLKEFWRHECELREGEKSYTSKISSPEHLSLFWEGLEESTKSYISSNLKINPSNVNTTNNNYYIQKTRWQVYAEKFFAHLLQKDELDPLQGAHLKQLAVLKTQVEKTDPELAQIINNYITTI